MKMEREVEGRYLSTSPEATAKEIRFARILAAYNRRSSVRPRFIASASISSDRLGNLFIIPGERERERERRPGTPRWRSSCLVRVTWNDRRSLRAQAGIRNKDPCGCEIFDGRVSESGYFAWDSVGFGRGRGMKEGAGEGFCGVRAVMVRITPPCRRNLGFHSL